MSIDAIYDAEEGEDIYVEPSDSITLFNRVSGLSGDVSGFRGDVADYEDEILSHRDEYDDLKADLEQLKLYINPSTCRQNEILDNISLTGYYHVWPSVKTVYKFTWPYGAGRYIISIHYVPLLPVISFELELSSAPLDYVDTPKFTAYSNITVWVRLMHARVEFHQSHQSAAPTIYSICKVI